MKKEQVLEAIKNLKKVSKKRKFVQTVDLVINLKEVDKKFNLDAYVHMPHETGKGVKVCAVVDTLAEQAEGLVDRVVSKDELAKLDAKQIGKLAKECDVFVAEASLMGQVATILGRILGPLGKMPNPKAGGVIMPGGDFKGSVEKFKSNLRLKNKNEASVKISIGKEDFEDENLCANAMAVYDAVVHGLPHGEGNVKDVVVKFTMSEPVRVGGRVKEEEGKEKSKIEIKEENVVRLKQKNNVIHLKAKPNKVILKRPKSNVVRLKQKEEKKDGKGKRAE